MNEQYFLNKEGLSHLALIIKLALDKRVEKVEGKGLSTKDLTNELKEKIMNAGSSNFSGNYQDLTNKPDLSTYATKTGVTSEIATAIADFISETDIDAKISTATTNMATVSSVATAITTALADYYTKTEVNTKLADYAKSTEVTTAITNALKTYYTKTQTDTAIANATRNLATTTVVDTKISNAVKNYATKTEMNTAIADSIKDITSFDYTIVTSLPTTGQKGTIYLISNSGTGNNIYDEYIYVNSKFEKIGTTQIDLTNYMQKSELVAITNAEIDEIFAE